MKLLKRKTMKTNKFDILRVVNTTGNKDSLMEATLNASNYISPDSLADVFESRLNALESAKIDYKPLRVVGYDEYTKMYKCKCTGASYELYFNYESIKHLI